MAINSVGIEFIYLLIYTCIFIVYYYRPIFINTESIFICIYKYFWNEISKSRLRCHLKISWGGDRYFNFLSYLIIFIKKKTYEANKYINTYQFDSEYLF